MGKEYQGNRSGGSSSFRGGSRGASRGGGGRGGGRGAPRQMDFGPPSYVIPYGTFMHRCENTFVVKCTDMSRFPKFNRGIYLENKSKVGSVDEIFGPVSAFYFSVKPAEGINPASFKDGQVFYANPEDLLQTDRLTKPGPRGKPSGPRGGAGARGGRGGSFGGGRGGSFGGGRGGSFGGGRGGNSFGGGRGNNRGGFGGRR